MTEDLKKIVELIGVAAALLHAAPEDDVLDLTEEERAQAQALIEVLQRIGEEPTF